MHDLLVMASMAYHVWLQVGPPATEPTPASGWSLQDWALVLTALGAASFLPKLLEAVSGGVRTIREDRQRKRDEQRQEQRQSGELGFRELEFRTTAEKQLRDEIWEMVKIGNARNDELNQRYGVVLAEKAAANARIEALERQIEQMTAEEQETVEEYERRIAQRDEQNAKHLGMLEQRLAEYETAHQREIGTLREAHAKEVALLGEQIKLWTDKYGNQGLAFSEREHELKKSLTEVKAALEAQISKNLLLESELGRAVRGSATRRGDREVPEAAQGGRSAPGTTEATARAAEATAEPAGQTPIEGREGSEEPSMEDGSEERME